MNSGELIQSITGAAGQANRMVAGNFAIDRLDMNIALLIDIPPADSYPDDVTVNWPNAFALQAARCAEGYIRLYSGHSHPALLTGLVMAQAARLKQQLRQYLSDNWQQWTRDPAGFDQQLRIFCTTLTVEFISLLNSALSDIYLPANALQKIQDAVAALTELELATFADILAAAGWQQPLSVRLERSSDSEPVTISRLHFSANVIQPPATNHSNG